jgi:proteic killer suppression protein
MIEGFGNQLAEDLFFDRTTREVRRLPVELRRAARRKLLYLHDAASLDDLRVPPGNRLELLRGDRRGFHSVRINDRWRLVFRREDGRARDVSVEDYHR